MASNQFFSCHYSWQVVKGHVIIIRAQLFASLECDWQPWLWSIDRGFIAAKSSQIKSKLLPRNSLQLYAFPTWNKRSVDRWAGYKIAIIPNLHFCTSLCKLATTSKPFKYLGSFVVRINEFKTVNWMLKPFACRHFKRGIYKNKIDSYRWNIPLFRPSSWKSLKDNSISHISQLRSLLWRVPVHLLLSRAKKIITFNSVQVKNNSVNRQNSVEYGFYETKFSTTNEHSSYIGQ